MLPPVRELSTIVETKAIEALKARYCRLLDTKDWAGFRELFTDDVSSDTVESGGKVLEGADEFVAFVKRSLSHAVTVHHVQQPEFEVTSEVDARGVWAMQDLVRFGPGATMHGFGHYIETYEKHNGEWKIRSSKLTRLRMEIQTPLVTVFVSPRVQRFIEWATRRWVR